MKYLKSLEQRDWDKINTRVVDREFKIYRKQLASLKPRLSRKTWKYFCEGFSETGIHDARLIALSVGDGLNALSRHLGAPNKIRIQADFLNHNRKYRFTFAYNDIKRFSFDFDATPGEYLIDLSSKQYFHDADHYLKYNHLSGRDGGRTHPRGFAVFATRDCFLLRSSYRGRGGQDFFSQEAHRQENQLIWLQPLRVSRNGFCVAQPYVHGYSQF